MISTWDSREGFLYLNICTFKQPTVQSRVRPPDSRPILFKRKSKFVLIATASLLFMTAANVAAVGRRHKKLPQPHSYMVFFVPPVNGARVEAHNTIFVLQINKTAA